jgi:hypothetical protein
MKKYYKPSVDNKLENKILLSTVSFLKGNIIALHPVTVPKQDVINLGIQGITTKLPCAIHG